MACVYVLTLLKWKFIDDNSSSVFLIKDPPEIDILLEHMPLPSMIRGIRCALLI